MSEAGRPSIAVIDGFFLFWWDQGLIRVAPRVRNSARPFWGRALFYWARSVGRVQKGLYEAGRCALKLASSGRGLKSGVGSDPSGSSCTGETAPLAR
jgi:hypothetical protein